MLEMIWCRDRGNAEYEAMETFRYLSLFSGIGGFEVAAEIANQAIGYEAFEVAALCEQNEFSQRVLNYHYPTIPLLPDVRNISVEFVREFGRIDGIVGGFPCQDVSNAGNRAGLDGERSGLFYEIIRLIRLVRPRFVYLENVAALVGRGLREVLGEFAAIGYDAEWSIIPCSTLGGSHRRERIWIVAYPMQSAPSVEEFRPCRQRLEPSNSSQSEVVRQKIGKTASKGYRASIDLSTPNSNSAGLEEWECQSTKQSAIAQPERHSSAFNWQDAVESLVRSCHDGIPFGLGDDSAYLLRLADIPAFLEYAADSLPIAHRKEALQAYGNAIVPQVGAIGFLKIYSILNG